MLGRLFSRSAERGKKRPHRMCAVGAFSLFSGSCGRVGEALAARSSRQKCPRHFLCASLCFRDQIRIHPLWRAIAASEASGGAWARLAEGFSATFFFKPSRFSARKKKEAENSFFLRGIYFFCFRKGVGKIILPSFRRKKASPILGSQACGQLVAAAHARLERSSLIAPELQPAPPKPRR